MVTLADISDFTLYRDTVLRHLENRDRFPTYAAVRRLMAENEPMDLEEHAFIIIDILLPAFAAGLTTWVVAATIEDVARRAEEKYKRIAQEVFKQRRDDRLERFLAQWEPTKEQLQ